MFIYIYNIYYNHDGHPDGDGGRGTALTRHYAQASLYPAVSGQMTAAFKLRPEEWQYGPPDSSYKSPAACAGTSVTSAFLIGLDLDQSPAIGCLCRVGAGQSGDIE